jgi:chitodextrinase
VKVSKHWCFKVVAAIAVVSGFAVAASTASAVIVTPVPGEPPLSYLPTLPAVASASSQSHSSGSNAGFACSFGSRDCALMQYYNGPVQHNMVEYFIYWSPSNYSTSSGTQYPAGFTDGMTTWLDDVAAASGTSGNVFAVANQYYDTVSGSNNYIGYSVTNGGAVTVTDPIPASNHCTDPGYSRCIDESDLANEIQSVVTNNGWPQNWNTEYTLYTPPGLADCAGGACLHSNFCAYHTWMGSSSNPIVWANEPYIYGDTGCDIGAINGSFGHPNGPIDPVVGTASHELMETITDPTTGAAAPLGGGWYDLDGAHEIGDKCAYDYNGLNDNDATGLPSNGNGLYNQTINGHQYVMQDEFSNANSNGSTTGCIATTPPTAAITGAPTSPTLTLTSIPFDGSTSTDSMSSPLTYSWNYGDGSTGSGATAAHSYAHSGAYTVTVAVQDANHFIDTAKTSVTISDRPPVAEFTVRTGVVAGSSASFNGGSSTDPDGSVTAWAWSFGDGSPGTGSAPSHSFAAPGTYTVGLTVTDNNGSASAPISQQLSVVPKAPVFVKTHLTESSTGKVTVQIRNPNVVSATGTVTLAAGGSRAHAAGKKGFSAGAGKTVSVKIKLSKAAQKYLKTHKRFKVHATALIKAGGTSNTTTKHASIKAAPTKKNNVLLPAIPANLFLF